MDDPDAGSIFLKLIFLLILVLINAFFAMSEIAIISLNDARLRHNAEDGDKRAKKVLRLISSPSSFLSTIQIGVTIAGFLTSASAAGYFSQPLAEWIAGWFGKTVAELPWLVSVSLVLVTLIISFFSLVLGELAPKRIAMQRSEKISYAVVGTLLSIRAFFLPFIKVLSFATNSVVRLLGFDPNASDNNVTEEEIRMLVDAGQETGVIEESQKEMINNIFEFDDIAAYDVMTHRTDIVAVEVTDTIQDVIEKAVEEGYSRIPVFKDDLDNIVGVVYVKDLLAYVGKSVSSEITVERIMRDAVFVPESKRCRDLFSEMSEKHIQMVFASDEYGGVAGLVTMEDLLEAIVGSMQDEYDDEEEEFEQIGENSFTIDGTTDIEEVEDLLDIKLPEGEYDTIGGLIMSQLGYIPTGEEQAKIECCGFSFTVVDVDERRIEKVLAERLPEPEVPQGDDKAKDKDKKEKE